MLKQFGRLIQFVGWHVRSCVHKFDRFMMMGIFPKQKLKPFVSKFIVQSSVFGLGVCVCVFPGLLLLLCFVF